MTHCPQRDTATLRCRGDFDLFYAVTLNLEIGRYGRSRAFGRVLSRHCGSCVPAGLVCQLVLLAMQLRTYRKTRHSSLLILAICSALAVSYLASGFATALYASRPTILWRLYLAMEVVFAAQIVLAIWGSASLFREFAQRRGGKEPEISQPAIPSTAIVADLERVLFQHPMKEPVVAQN